MVVRKKARRKIRRAFCPYCDRSSIPAHNIMEMGVHHATVNVCGDLKDMEIYQYFCKTCHSVFNYAPKDPTEIECDRCGKLIPDREGLMVEEMDENQAAKSIYVCSSSCLKSGDTVTNVVTNENRIDEIDEEDEV